MGASGNTGRRISERLLGGGEPVRVLGRSAERLEGLVQKGAEAAVGEATDRDYLSHAFEGADAAYLLIPQELRSPDYGAFQDRVGGALTEAIRQRGVGRVVLLSSIGADQPSGTGPIAGLHRQEERLRGLEGADVLALRPGFFFENYLDSLALIKHQGINGGAMAPDMPMGMIATRDIAAAAADALLERDFSGFEIRELLGPRDLTLTEATRIIGEAVGRPELPYVQLSYDEFRAALVQIGMSASVAETMTEMAQGFNEGRVRSLEGRTAANTTPTTLESFAAAVLAPAYETI
jgi:uncharacterized protein YbjT (DUF2867 family)